MPTSSATSAVQVLVTLVHGTWGGSKLPFSGPLWFEDGSKFVGALQSVLEANGIVAPISAFRWSGANSLAERADASDLLARYLNHQKLQHPDALQVVVGHSHGGTLCMLTLKNLSEDVKPIFITLATPYMEIINTDATPSADLLKKTVAKRAAEPAVIVIAMAVAGLVSSTSPYASSAYNMVYCVGMICMQIVPFFLGIKKEGVEGPDDLG